MKNFDPPDRLIALIIVVGCFVLRFCGIDSEVMSILAIAAGWLFGGAYRARRELKQQNGKAKTPP